MGMMTMRDVAMVAGFLVIAGLTLVRCGTVVRRRVLMMIRCFAMMFYGFFGHVEISLTDEV